MRFWIFGLSSGTSVTGVILFINFAVSVMSISMSKTSTFIISLMMQRNSVDVRWSQWWLLAQPRVYSEIDSSQTSVGVTNNYLSIFWRHLFACVLLSSSSPLASFTHIITLNYYLAYYREACLIVLRWLFCLFIEYTDWKRVVGSLFQYYPISHKPQSKLTIYSPWRLICRSKAEIYKNLW